MRQNPLEVTSIPYYTARMHRQLGHWILIAALFVQGISAAAARVADPAMHAQCEQHAMMDQDSSTQPSCCDEHCATMQECAAVCATCVAVFASPATSFPTIMGNQSGTFSVVQIEERSYAPLYPPPIA